MPRNTYVVESWSISFSIFVKISFTHPPPTANGLHHCYVLLQFMYLQSWSVVWRPLLGYMHVQICGDAPWVFLLFSPLPTASVVWLLGNVRTGATPSVIAFADQLLLVFLQDMSSSDEWHYRWVGKQLKELLKTMFLFQFEKVAFLYLNIPCFLWVGSEAYKSHGRSLRSETFKGLNGNI